MQKFLIERESTELKSVNTLKEAWLWVKNNDPTGRNITIVEFEGDNEIDVCSATYLLSNYRDYNKVPSSLLDA